LIPIDHLELLHEIKKEDSFTRSLFDKMPFDFDCNRSIDFFLALKLGRGFVKSRKLLDFLNLWEAIFWLISGNELNHLTAKKNLMHNSEMILIMEYAKICIGNNLNILRKNLIFLEFSGFKVFEKIVDSPQEFEKFLLSLNSKKANARLSNSQFADTVIRVSQDNFERFPGEVCQMLFYTSHLSSRINALALRYGILHDNELAIQASINFSSLSDSDVNIPDLVADVLTSISGKFLSRDILDFTITIFENLSNSEALSIKHISVDILSAIKDFNHDKFCKIDIPLIAKYLGQKNCSALFSLASLVSINSKISFGSNQIWLTVIRRINNKSIPPDALRAICNTLLLHGDQVIPNLNSLKNRKNLCLIEDVNSFIYTKESAYIDALIYNNPSLADVLTMLKDGIYSSSGY
jgi:hypothetical protein